MTYKLNPSYIITDFIRSNLDDVKGRVTLESNNSTTISNENVVDITANNKISHIANVKVDGITIEKYSQWVYDTKNRKLVFRTAQSGEVTYDVYTGTNFIFPDQPKNNLSDDSFPRVSIQKVSTVGNVLGNNKSEIVTIYRYQIKTYAKKEAFVGVNIYKNTQVNYEGQDLSEFINLRLYEVFKNYRHLLEPLFSNYELNEKEVFEGFDSSIGCYVIRQEFTITHLKENYID